VPEPSPAVTQDGRRSAPVLRLDRISKRFGKLLANDEVSFEVARGSIHALLGENGAGKSTLMNLVFGLLHPDGGTIEVGGEPAAIEGPRDAREHGIGMVHQHFKLVGDMTVLENVALSQGGMGLAGLELGRLRERLAGLSSRFNLGVDPDATIEALSVGEQQRVEILKLLIGGAEILILDEPTAVLTPAEWEGLAAILRRLVGEGRTVVFISHKLGEIFDVADRCTVLRDGAVVGTREIAATDKAELARLMVGRDVALRAERERLPAGEEVLAVEGLVVADGEREAVAGLDFTVHAGEVLGVAGVDGNGQAELVEALSGNRRFEGTVRLLGDRLAPGTRTARDPRIGVIPEDRHRDGVALELSVADNLMMRRFDRDGFARFGFRRGAAVRAHSRRLIEEFDIRTPSPAQPLGRLSGGNQQKVVLARELDRGPRLLIAAQPTRGLDIGAMEFVYGRIAEFKRGGGATLLISTELEEVMSLSDRIAVMVGGRFVAILDNEDATLDRVGSLMAGVEERVGA
jgi:simple sugar transport system ATP-binding protein